VIVRVAVLADTSLQRHLLQQALSTQGYSIALNSDPQQIRIEDVAAYQVDIWLVNLLQADDGKCQILEHLYETETPVLFGEGQAPERHSEDYPRWERSLFSKMDKLLQNKPLQSSTQEANGDLIVPERLSLPEALAKLTNSERQPATEVWLLAASLGGPSAVKEFLDVLPSGLPIGFIYAQHIDASFEEKLPQAVGRHSEWQVRLAQHCEAVYSGEVVIVPVQNELSFTETGKVNILDSPWSGLYSPSIDQVMFNLTQRYGQHSGIIVFSGMGEDGSQACAYAKKQGALIWVQSAESCACPSMPDSIRKTGHSSYSSTPRGLAMAMLNHLIQRYTANSMRIS